MKTRFFLVMMISVAVLTNCYAQKDKKKDKKSKETTTVVTPPTTPEVPAVAEQKPVTTEECNMNISLFNESAKNKQYADAIGPWTQVYTNCPAANKAIYSRGREIVQWELTQTKDAASYQKVFEKLMKLFDDRIKYFGDDEKYPTAWILGMKGLDYVTLAKNDDLKKPAYEWLGKSVDGMQERCEIEVLRQYLIVSNNMFKANAAHGENYINDFVKVNGILEKIAADPNNKNATVALQVKSAMESMFASSGAADCNMMDKIYKDVVPTKLADKDYLTNVCNFYKRVRCSESEVYFQAATALHKIKPSEESAAGCGAMAYKQGEFTKSIDFYNEATKLAADVNQKADYQYTVAQIYFKELNNFPRSREFARKAIELVPNYGKAYLLIGMMYVRSRGVYDDPILQKTVYWVAVDKFIKAKSVDPSIADDANKAINSASAGFPTKEDVFMHPELNSKSTFFVGGWIGESTSVRK